MDKQHKTQIKKAVRWIVLALLVLLLTVMPLIAGEKAQEEGPQASTLTGTVQVRDLEISLIGGGQLASSSSEAVTIPKAIKLTEYLVKNGDIVHKDDPIARVDKVSVMVALEAVQETLDYLSKQMSDAGNVKESDKVVAQAGGLVKILYAQPGDSVRDVMLQHGALAVLSLDGRMAVEIPCAEGPGGGDPVTVTFSDGTAVRGRVETNRMGALLVTLEDKGYAIGETVTITDSEGTELGSGDLSIHSPWNAAAYHGTIVSVDVREGQKLTAGKSFHRKIQGFS